MNQRKYGIHAGTDLKASFLLASFHSSGKCYVHYYQERKLIINLAQECHFTSLIKIMTGLGRHNCCWNSYINKLYWNTNAIEALTTFWFYLSPNPQYESVTIIVAQEPVAWQYISPRKETTAMILINRHSIKVIGNWQMFG